jgi:hypothetical protein
MPTLVAGKSVSEEEKQENQSDELMEKIFELFIPVSEYGLEEEWRSSFAQYELKDELRRALMERKYAQQESDINYFSEKIIFLHRLENIYDQLSEKDEFLEREDKSIMLQKLNQFFEGRDYNQLNDLNESDLKDRIDKILAVEMLSGLFDDLSEDEKEIVEEASKRRPFFG